LAWRDGEPYLAWGSPGGDQQDQWTTQLFLRHVHCGLNLQEAIDAPAWHSGHFPISFWPRTARPGVLVVESRVPAETQKELKARGHVLEVGPAWSEGRLTAAARDGRRRNAAANPRGVRGSGGGRGAGGGGFWPRWASRHFGDRAAQGAVAHACSAGHAFPRWRRDAAAPICARIKTKREEPNDQSSRLRHGNQPQCR